MTKTVKARFANGVLTPLEAIDLPEGALVSLHIGEISSTEPDAPATETQPSSVASRASIIDGSGPVNYNLLNDEIMDQEYFEKERRIRERNA
jgi:predicted DNA-binding antitoxin AbrB/MazE fold protein